MKLRMPCLALALLLAIYAIVFLTGCDDDCPDVQNPECENYDPCFGRDAEPENLDFTISNRLGITEVLVSGDTMMNNWRVAFAPQFEANEYEWKIGNEVSPRFGDTVTINFRGFSGDINVRLIARQICEGNELRADTITKEFYLVDIGVLEEAILPIHGDFMGSVNDKPEDEFIVTISPTIVENGKRQGINNIPPECGDRALSSLLFLDYIPAWKYFYILKADSPQTLCYPQGEGILSGDNSSLTIKYFYFEQDDEGNFINLQDTIWKTFTGTRI